MSNKKETKVISFISGKGGVGKTAVTAAAGKILANLGYRVLIIDSDLVTHGMTFLLGFKEKTEGILEFRSSRLELFNTLIKKGFEVGTTKLIRRLICKLSDDLYFIQSTSRPSLKYSEIVALESNKLREFLGLLVENIVDFGEFDFILIDAQAGPVPTTFSAVKKSDKTVIVMEPDPIATYATQNAVTELADNLPKESFYLINKISVEEASAYLAIEKFLRILRHLPPIPFDFQVRRSFMTRSIPIDETNPSAFMIGMIRMLSDLIPEARTRLLTLEEKCRRIALGPTEEKIRDVEKEIEQLTIHKVRLEQDKSKLRTTEARYSAMINLLGPAMLAVMVILVIMSLFYQVGLILSAVAITITGLYVLALYGLIRWRRTPIEEAALKADVTTEILSEKISDLRSQLASYRNLMMTTASELTLMQGNNHETKHGPH